VVDLDRPEDEILGGMKSKTRYNIRLAARKDVLVKELESVDPFYQMLERTADRSEFGIHQKDYYRKVYELFEPQNACQLFLAEYQEIPLASIMVFQRGKRSWYFYGASAPVHRDRMPTYLVQWEAMRWARKQGCTSYDLWGVPDYSQETLEEQFLERQEGLWGVYRFKRGFGGALKRAAGPWDRIYKPVLYKAYQARNWLDTRVNI
jgi:lipid II:glycine glycyltransferase (peptidoglycan interpeptide bridge formation enzyme)